MKQEQLSKQVTDQGNRAMQKASLDVQELFRRIKTKGELANLATMETTETMMKVIEKLAEINLIVAQKANNDILALTKRYDYEVPQLRERIDALKCGCSGPETEKGKGGEPGE